MTADERADSSSQTAFKLVSEFPRNLPTDTYNISVSVIRMSILAKPLVILKKFLKTAEGRLLSRAHCLSMSLLKFQASVLHIVGKCRLVLTAPGPSVQVSLTRPSMLSVSPPECSARALVSMKRCKRYTLRKHRMITS